MYYSKQNFIDFLNETLPDNAIIVDVQKDVEQSIYNDFVITKGLLKDYKN
jgi:hypothetical protein